MSLAFMVSLLMVFAIPPVVIMLTDPPDVFVHGIAFIGLGILFIPLFFGISGVIEAGHEAGYDMSVFVDEDPTQCDMISSGEATDDLCEGSEWLLPTWIFSGVGIYILSIKIANSTKKIM